MERINQQPVLEKPSPEFIVKFKKYIFNLQDEIVAGLQEQEENKFSKIPWKKDLGKLKS